MKLRRRKPLSTRLNVTPLIDVVFILLVFFMLTTNFDRFRLVTLDAPEETELTADPEAAVVIRILDDGALEFDGDPASEQQVAGRIAALTRTAPNRPFLVRPAASIDIQDALDIYHLARSAGARNVSFSRPLEGGE